MSVRAHILVSGHVQGVWFRANAQRLAGQLRLVGWVANLPDGRVEIEAQGEKDFVDGLIEWCQKGPNLAQVMEVHVEWIAPKEGEKAFWIRR